MSASFKNTTVLTGISVVGSVVNLSLFAPAVDEIVNDIAPPVAADVMSVSYTHLTLPTSRSV